ncbi:PhoP regulatory network YrbL family protein [Halomonas sediminis]
MAYDIPYIPATSFVNLTEADLIGRGNKRACYKHPDDSRLCIKVARNAGAWHENVIEWIYINHLKQQGVPLDHLIDCYDWTNTNFGPGLVFERVMDEDGTPSPTLAEAIRTRRVEISDISPMLVYLKEWAIGYSVVVAELNSVNLLLQKKNGGYNLMMVDGVGGRDRITWKFYMYRKSKLFSRMKTRKQIKRLEPVLFDEVSNICAYDRYDI